MPWFSYPIHGDVPLYQLSDPPVLGNGRTSTSNLRGKNGCKKYSGHLLGSNALSIIGGNQPWSGHIHILRYLRILPYTSNAWFRLIHSYTILTLWHPLINWHPEKHHFHPFSSSAIHFQGWNQSRSDSPNGPHGPRPWHGTSECIEESSSATLSMSESSCFCWEATEALRSPEETGMFGQRAMLFGYDYVIMAWSWEDYDYYDYDVIPFKFISSGWWYT